MGGHGFVERFYFDNYMGKWGGKENYISEENDLICTCLLLGHLGGWEGWMERLSTQN